MPKFKIEQIAIAPFDVDRAMKLLADMGSTTNWIKDHVVATGKLYDRPVHNEANLYFNYQIIKGDEIYSTEFEMLEYTSGKNWLSLHGTHIHDSCVSHFGMHCTEQELEEWKTFFAERGIPIAQDVVTDSHTNPAIKDRHYHYVIFRTRDILGVDLKFIVRL